MPAHEDLSLTEAPHSGGCGCHEHEEALPALDARVIPHAIRHGAIIGAFGQVRPGSAMALIAPHNPLPLLAQLEDLFGDDLDVSYLEEGPQAWKLRLAKRA